MICQFLLIILPSQAHAHPASTMLGELTLHMAQILPRMAWGQAAPRMRRRRANIWA